MFAANMERTKNKGVTEEVDDPIETTVHEVKEPEDEICTSTDEEVVIDYLQYAVDHHWDYVTIDGDFDFDFLYLRSLDYSAFWVRSFQIENHLDNGCIKYFLMYNENDLAHLDEMKKEMDKSVDQIIAQIPSDADEWEICKIVHDELIKMTDNGIKNSDLHTKDAYGPLGMHEATCVGYSSAFKMVLGRLGIPCRLVCSDTHAWVWMGDDPSCGYIDIYWDDGDYINDLGEEVPHYTYFGMTDEELERISAHEIENVGLTLNDTDIDFENYHEHEGYVLDEYDFDDFFEMVQEQYADGKCAIEIRFTDKDEYDKCVWELLLDTKASMKLFTKLHYSGQVYKLYSDAEGIYVVTFFVDIDNPEG